MTMDSLSALGLGAERVGVMTGRFQNQCIHEFQDSILSPRLILSTVLPLPTQSVQPVHRVHPSIWLLLNLSTHSSRPTDPLTASSQYQPSPPSPSPQPLSSPPSHNSRGTHAYNASRQPHPLQHPTKQHRKVTHPSSQHHPPLTSLFVPYSIHSVLSHLLTTPSLGSPHNPWPYTNRCESSLKLPGHTHL